MNKRNLDIQHTEAEPPLFEADGIAVLTGFKKGEKRTRYAVIAVHDPLGFKTEAADYIAAFMTNATDVTRNTMFTIVNAFYKDTEILIASTGSGAPETEIVLLDMMQYAGVDTFLRIGTSGTQRPDVNVGDVIITSGAVRDEGLTQEYISSTFPAVASYELLLAMIESAEELSLDYHVGITRSSDSIYCGQGRSANGYLPPSQERTVEYWRNAGVLNVERETSAILTLPLLFGGRGGAVNVACNSSITQKVGVTQGIDDAIRVGLDGLALLAKRDNVKERAGKKWWYTGLEK